MTDVVSSARTARERLAQGLGALQSPGVPDHLMNVAEPIARAMSALHRIEASGGQAVREAGPAALDAVRAALAQLQAQTVAHPSVDAALEAVAGSLGMVHMLVKVTSAPPPAPVQPSAPPPAPVQPSAPPPAPVYPPVAATNPAPAPATTPLGRPAPAAPAAAFAATALASGSAPLGATVPHAPNQAGPASMESTVASAGVARPFGNTPGPDSAFAPNSTLQSNGAERPPPSLQQASGSPYTSMETQPEARPLQVSSPGQLRIEAALGAHSPTNFYKGLSGNDVVDAGGIFVATYQIPRIGTPLLLKVSLPGGYEFEAQAIVRWTRDPASASDGSSPGFGAQFTAISPEGRQLVYRYVRNREPLFHDDL